MNSLSDRFDSYRKERNHGSSDRYRDKDENEVEPSFEGYQLIGDSQFLRFAEQILRKERRKSNGLAFLGLCVSGQKISDLLRRVKDKFHGTSRKAVLMIGTNDLLQNTKISEMCRSIEQLVIELCGKGNVKKLILLTIPPVPRLKTNLDHWLRIREYNEKIKTFHNNKDIFVVDAYTKFIDFSNLSRRSSLVSQNSTGNSSTRRNSPASTHSIKYPHSLSSNSSQPLRTDIRISIGSSPVQVGQKRKIYVVNGNDEKSSEFETPNAKRRSHGSSRSFADDDHDDTFLGEEIDVEYEKIKMHYFEEYFGNNSSRKDLIHLNRSGLRLIKELIGGEIGRQKKDEYA